MVFELPPDLPLSEQPLGPAEVVAAVDHVTASDMDVRPGLHVELGSPPATAGEVVVTDSSPDPDAIPETTVADPERVAASPQHERPAPEPPEEPKYDLVAAPAPPVPALSKARAADTRAVTSDVVEPRGDKLAATPVKADGAEHKPLFVPIERGEPDPEAPPSRLLPPGDTLRAFGVADSLAGEVEDLSKQLQPFASMGLNRLPKAGEQRLEGRGAYHGPMRLDSTGDREITVYVKGVGSRHAIQEDQEDRAYPGYPDRVETMLYDAPKDPNAYARVKGAVVAEGASLEQVHLAAVFAGLARREGWQTLQQALDAKVSIPLGGQYQPGLTQHVRGLKARYIQEGPNAAAREILSKWRADYLGTTMLLVPSDRRLVGGVDLTAEALVAPLGIQDSRAVGRTLRMLADTSGTAFSWGSAHRQNFYTTSNPGEALVVQGDNQDLVTLGAHGDRAMSAALQARYGTAGVIPKDIVRTALLAEPFRRDAAMPRHLPVLEDMGDEEAFGRHTRDPQLAFWGAMLDGLAEPGAIAKIPELAPYLQKEIGVAAAILVQEAADQELWKMVAQQKEAVIASTDPRYRVAEEYVAGNAKAMSDQRLAAYDRMLRDPYFQADLVAHFLKTGDERWLRAVSPHLALKIRLQENVANVADTKQRHELMYFLGNDGMQYDMNRVMHPESLTDEFSGVHSVLLTDLLEAGRIDDALRLAEILATASEKTVRDKPAIAALGEQVGHYYGRMAIGCRTTEQLSDLLVRVRFETALQGLVGQVLPDTYRAGRPDQNAPFEIRRADAVAALANGSRNMNDYALAYDLPAPGEAVKGILAQILEYPEVAAPVADWLALFNRMNDLTQAMAGEIDEEIVSAIDRALSIGLEGRPQLQQLFPELAFLQNAWIAAHLEYINPDLAQTYFDQAVAYYERDYPRQRAFSTIDPNSIKPSRKTSEPRWIRTFLKGRITLIDPMTDGRQFVSETYQNLRLPGIAEQYTPQSTQHAKLNDES